MTVSAQTPLNRSTGNGVTTVFPYNFKILAAGDIEVSVDGVVKTLTTHYTLSGVGADAGGNVTMVTPPANGAIVVRRRNMALIREVDYQDQGELPTDTLDDDQDAPILMLQQIEEQLSRALMVPITSSQDPADFLDDLFAAADDATAAAGAAAASETAAAGSATNAANSATAASNSATSASGSAAAAAASAAAAAATALSTVLTGLSTATNAAITAADSILSAFGKLQKQITDLITTVGGKATSGAITGSGLTMATARLLGRTTASTGAVEEITVGAGLALSSGTLTGKFVQAVEATPYTTYSSTGTAAIYDDTIPQISEGAELMTVTITPTSATNRLRIEFSGNFGSSLNGDVVWQALFQDATANALAATANEQRDALTHPSVLVHEMAAGTTSATTFRIRWGSNGATAYVNGSNVTRKFGGVMAARLRVTEVAP